MGELHLDIIVDRLIREFKVECRVGKPQVAYRESITKTVRTVGSYIRQNAGKGVYGHCAVEFAPGAPGSGFVFENAVPPSVLPPEYVKAVEEGIREACISTPSILPRRAVMLPITSPKNSSGTTISHFMNGSSSTFDHYEEVAKNLVDKILGIIYQ